jgi:hypothetical protein
MSYEPIKIPELEGNFCEARQFDWMSYLSSGDVAKYMEFRRMADTQDRSTQARALAVHVMGEIERVARCRMAEAPRPVSREVAPGETVKSAAFVGIPFHPDGILVPSGTEQCSPPAVGPQPPAKPLDDLVAEMRERLSDLASLPKTKENYKELLDLHSVIAFAERERRSILL